MVLLIENGHYLSAARKKVGLSQFATAARMGVSPGLLSQIDRGYTPPDLRTLEAYAAVVRADVSVIHHNLVLALPRLQAANHRIVEDVAALLVRTAASPTSELSTDREIA
jgi:transcriptional regulator with XRE-family HTH domain